MRPIYILILFILAACSNNNETTNRNTLNRTESSVADYYKDKLKYHSISLYLDTTAKRRTLIVFSGIGALPVTDMEWKPLQKLEQETKLLNGYNIVCLLVDDKGRPCNSCDTYAKTNKELLLKYTNTESLPQYVILDDNLNYKRHIGSTDKMQLSKFLMNY